MTNVILSVLMIAGIALLAGAYVLHSRGGERKKIWLMVIAALVMFANLAIWSLPTQSGQTLADQTLADQAAVDRAAEGR